MMGDTAYSAAENLHYLVADKNIEPHIPAWDKRQRKDEIFSINDFRWYEEKDEYRCPSGKPLHSQLQHHHKIGFSQKTIRQPEYRVFQQNHLRIQAIYATFQSLNSEKECCL